MQRTFVVSLVVFLGLSTARCTDRRESGPTAPPSAVIDCQIGCVEEDADPTAPGVFLGSGVTPDVCISGGYTDADQDQLGDFCEKKLALAFAPELAYYHADQIGREPHWAARPLGGDTLRIGYMLSYYVDGGTSYELHPECAWLQGLCDGHYGDSEWIMLDVGYDWEADHWVLRRAYYSTHTNVHTYLAGPSGYPSVLTYPSHVGAYPRSIVAINKHANSATIGECEEGGYGTDDCSPDTYARVSAGGNLNVGSRAHPFLDCIPSSNPLYATNGNLECYWTDQRFRGWQGAIPDAGAYSGKLAAYGF